MRPSTSPQLCAIALLVSIVTRIDLTNASMSEGQPAGANVVADDTPSPSAGCALASRLKTAAWPVNDSGVEFVKQGGDVFITEDVVDGGG